MFQFSTFVVLVASLSAFASPFSKRTVAQVEADIASISSGISSLDNAINAFPNSGGTLAEALAIHNNATNLASAISQGTTDITSTGALSEADGNTIITSIEAFQPTIIDSLNAIVAKKPAFEGLPISGVTALVKQDLATLNGNTTAFENALLAVTPADLQANATAIKTAVDAAFSTAIAAYANA